MKKYLLVLFGVITMFISFTSCINNEDIDITYHHDVTVEVNPIGLYEEIGSPSAFQEWMALDFLSLKFNLEVTLLVYNKDGSLNQRIDKTVDTLLPFSMYFSDLDEDDYTIVAIQQMVINDTRYDDTHRAWELENTSKINHVRIVTTEFVKDYGIPWFMCLGIKTQEVSIRKGMTIKIATEMTGSFVDVNYENMNYSKFNWSALCFGNQARGIYLNPELQGQSRYYYENKGFFMDYWSIIYQYYYDDIIDFNLRFFLDSGEINYCFKFDYFENLDDIDVGNLDFKYELSSGNAIFEAEKGKLYSAFCYYNGETDKFTTYMGLASEFQEWYDSLEKWNIPPDYNDDPDDLLPDDIENPDDYFDPAPRKIRELSEITTSSSPLKIFSQKNQELIKEKLKKNNLRMKH